MDQFNVHQPKKLYNSDNVKSKESTQNTPYIPAMHQEQKDSVSFSGGNRPASAEKASDAVLLGFSRLMQGFEGQTFNSELNKILKNSIETLKQSNIFEDYDGAEKNIDNFIQVYFESFVIDSEVAAQTALEGGLKNVLKDDKELSIMLLINLSDKISINSDKKESKAAYTLINKIAQLPDNEIDEKVKKYANFKANAIDLSLKVKNENYGGIIQSAIKLCKIDYGTDKTKIQTVISRISKLIKNEEKGLQLVNTITQYIKSNPNSDDASICKLILQKISTLDERENEVNGAVKYEARNKLKELETQNEVKVPNKLASLDTALNAKPFNKDNVISTTLDIVKKEPEMANDVVGKISAFLISENDSNMPIQLFYGLFNNITSNATSDEGLLNALGLILQAFIDLPKDNTNSEIEAHSEVFLKRLNLFKLINNKNSRIEDILNAGIDYMKYNHPQVGVDKPLNEFIPLLKDDDKGPLFIKALYGKACEKGIPLTKGLYDDDRAKKTMQDDLKVVRSLFEKINELLLSLLLFEDIQISENVRNIFENAYIACLSGNYEFTFPNQQGKVPQDISAKIMNLKEGCALVKDLAIKSLQNDIEANKTLEQISRLPDSEVNKKVKQYALICLQNETLEKELKKGKECNMSNLVDNALSIASSNNVNYQNILNKFITFIQNNEKKDTNQQLNNKLFSNLYKKSKCYPPTNESTTALSLLKSLESQQNGVIGEVSKKRIKMFITLSNLYNLANNPGTKMEEIVNNMLESKAFLKEQHYAGIDYLILQKVQNILTDVNKGHELIKILFEKAKNPQQQQDVMEFLLGMLNCESPGEINENVKKTAQNAYIAIPHKQEKYKVSMP